MNKVLAIIPARGGSKRLKNKNILPLNGKPLIRWTIDTALNSTIIDKIIVSSDSDSILEVTQDVDNVRLEAVRRPAVIAGDTATQEQVIRHVLDNYGEGFETVILLQPTSPLRMAKDIEKAFSIYSNQPCNSVVSFGEVDHPTAHVTEIDETGNVDRLIDVLSDSPKRTQEFNKEYRINGAIYIFSKEQFLRNGKIFSKPTLSYIMPRERSIDIDNAIDFSICEMLIEKNNIRI